MASCIELIASDVKGSVLFYRLKKGGLQHEYKHETEISGLQKQPCVTGQFHFGKVWSRKRRPRTTMWRGHIADLRVWCQKSEKMVEVRLRLHHLRSRFQIPLKKSVNRLSTYVNNPGRSTSMAIGMSRTTLCTARDAMARTQNRLFLIWKNRWAGKCSCNRHG